MPERTLDEQYRPSLVKFMSFKDGVNYPKGQQFTRNELAAITPEQLTRWMQLKVYGTADPLPTDNPTEGRSSSLEYAKKAISFYMPNRLMQWNVMAIPPTGNPTKSILVNDLIKLVKKKEVRKQGKPSQARKAFDEQEYETIIAKLEACENDQTRLFSSGVVRFQYNMIARIDDACQFLSENLKTNPEHPLYAALSQLCWSKNVQEERDAPDQIILGAMDAKYCVLLGLACWLEYFIATGNEGISEYLFAIEGTDDPAVINRRASNCLKYVLGDDDLVEMILETGGKRGTHSTRKFATSRARRNGCYRDETDWRARWKRKSQQDKYAECTVPWPDAKVASALCKGGPIHYSVKEGSGISEEWILRYVCPAIRTCYGRSLSLVLGRALLWRIFDRSEAHVVPATIRNRVKRAYRDLGERCRLLNEENPVEKVPLLVTGEDAMVFIDVLDDDDDGDAGNRNGRRVRPRRRTEEELRHLRSLVVGLKRDNANLKAGIDRLDARMSRKLTIMGENVGHLRRGQHFQRPPAQGEQQGRRNIRHINAEDEMNAQLAQEQNQTPATLSTTPRTLHALWNEYEFGLGGRKAAKDFTAQERGRVKYKYSRRKVVWNMVEEMVRGGYDSNEACNRIYQVYGPNQSVTQIIDRMKIDKRTGGHPALRNVNL